jgi:hypothetical protein
MMPPPPVALFTMLISPSSSSGGTTTTTNIAVDAPPPAVRDARTCIVACLPGGCGGIFAIGVVRRGGDAMIIRGRRHDRAAVGRFDDNVSTVATRIATTRPLLLLLPGEAIALLLPHSLPHPLEDV